MKIVENLSQVKTICSNDRRNATGRRQINDDEVRTFTPITSSTPEKTSRNNNDIVPSPARKKQRTNLQHTKQLS